MNFISKATAFGSPRAATIAASATVASSCTRRAAPPGFRTYDPAVADVATDATATAPIDVTRSAGTRWTLTGTVTHGQAVRDGRYVDSLTATVEF